MIALQDWEALIQRLVNTGKRIGKAPWCCDGFAEDETATRLYYGHGITGRETMEEAMVRHGQTAEVCK